MAARLLLIIVVGLLVFVLVLTMTYRRARDSALPSARRVPWKPPPELDVSAMPAEWYTDSWSEGTETVVGIVLVETNSRTVRQRRALSRLDNADPDYAAELDRRLDDAYQAMRVANVHLHRR